MFLKENINLDGYKCTLITKKHQIHSLSKLESKEIYIMHFSSSDQKPTSHNNFEKLSQKFDL